MRLIIEARLEAAHATFPAAATLVAVLERPDQSVADLGLTLAEGRALLAQAQSILVSHQVADWTQGQLACRRCGAALAHKDRRTIVMRTVFGKVELPSPRLWVWRCASGGGKPRRSVSPLCKAVPRRVTLELEYLQAGWAAHLPYRQATQLLREVLPQDQGISLGSTRRKVLAVGAALDAQIEREIVSSRKITTDTRVRESTSVGCVSVHKQVSCAAARLDQFLCRSGVQPDERVTGISDDAGEFEKAVAGSRLARGRILDWFHIAMKFQAAERSVFGSKSVALTERGAVEQAIRSAKWLVWHGKGSKAVARIKAFDAALMASDSYEDSTLWWNLRRLCFNLDNNAGTLANYGARYRKGLPISSGIAESAVNQVVSHRMAKKQQMRWTDEGAHCLVQVRVADLNAELSVQRLAALARRPAANSPSARRAA